MLMDRSRCIAASTRVAGVVGDPVAHSLSPLIHNAWLEAAGVDGVYVAFRPGNPRFETFVEGLRGGSLAGLNVTLPFKVRALALCDDADATAQAAGAANLLLFHADGRIEARNTDGLGLVAAFAEQAPGLELAQRPCVVIGAGGAARGAVATLVQAGAPHIRIVNRTLESARALAETFPGRASACGLEGLDAALDGAGAIVNASSAGLAGGASLAIDFGWAPPDAVAMDMVYSPLRTDFLRRAAGQGLTTVDGLAMLIGQARPAFAALYGVEAPRALDVRRLAIQALGAAT